MKLKKIIIPTIAATSLCTALYGSDSYKTTASCSGNSSWLNSSYSVSTEINGDENCAFQQFGWEWFIESVRATKDTNAQFEAWMPSGEIFVANGETPTPWATKTTKREMGKNNTGHRVNVSAVDQAGSMQPLITQNGEYVYYEVIVNKPAYDFITECNLYKTNCASTLKYENTHVDVKIPSNLSFPNNSVELKNAWMVLDDSSPKDLFFETVGTVKNPDTNKSETKRLGLIGMHLIVNTKDHPEFIWATFEHRNNAPDCDNLSAKPPLGGEWNLYNPKITDKSILNEYFEGKATQVCRMNPYGTPTNTKGLDKETIKRNQINEENIISINSSMVNIIKENKNFNQIWANYEMTGNIWTKGGVLPPLPSYQRGSLSAENMTMETYTQNGSAGINYQYNCFSCHKSNFGESSAEVAHIFDEAVFDGGCSDNQLPKKCLDKYRK